MKDDDETSSVLSYSADLDNPLSWLAISSCHIVNSL